MGFAGVREIFALVDRVHAELKVGGGEVEWIGYGNASSECGGPRTGVYVWGGAASLSLISAWGGAEGRWVSDPCTLSSLPLSLYLSPGNHLKVK